MTSMSVNPLFVAGMLILVVAICGGAVAAWLNIQACPGPRERRLVGLCTLMIWLLIGLLLWLMVVVPSPGRYLLIVPYFTVLPWFIYRVSVRRQKLRVLERMESQKAGRATDGEDRNQA